MKAIYTLLILLIPFIGFGQITAYSYSFDAKSAGVFFGMWRRINLYAKLTF